MILNIKFFEIITLLLILVIITLIRVSPLRIAFLIILFSLNLGILVYNVSSRIFPASGLIICFSSGIIIIFCYCRVRVNYIAQTFSKKKIILTALAIPLIRLTIKRKPQYSNKEIRIIINSRTILVVCMLIVVLTIVLTNKTLLNPYKSFKSSY